MCYLCAVAAGFAGGDSSGGSANHSKYRYYPKDFGPLSIRPLHVDLTFDVKPGQIRVTNIATYVYNECKDSENSPLDNIALDCNGLQVDYVGVILNNASSDAFTPVDINNLRQVDWNRHIKQFQTTPSTVDEEKDYNPEQGLAFTTIDNFNIDTYNQKLNIPLPSQSTIAVGQQFIVKTITVAYPSANDLEGIYFDYTPQDCPKTMVSQCQQYGYRKITPGIDQMPSKMYYTTTIIADARYTNISTNGNYADGFYTRNNTTGIIAPSYQLPSSHYQLVEDDKKLDEQLTNRVVMRYHIWNDPMATYLFYFGVGTYVTYSRQVEYPLPSRTIGENGVKTSPEQTNYRSFEIQLMVFPSFFTPTQCVEKLREINDAILWAHISLGPESTEHVDARKKIYELIERREEIKDRLHAEGSQYGVVARISSVGNQFTFQKNPLEVLLTTKSSNDENTTPLQHIAEEGKQPVALYHPESFPYPVTITDDERQSLEAELVSIRQELSQLFDTWKIDFGHSFKDVIYREIAMQNSLFGGMENRAATTIISSRIAPSSYLSDQAYLYMIGVTIHEYYHDLNGSMVTAQSPFGLWLNEAVTVHMQRYYEYKKFGFDLIRMGHVHYALDPSAGPLAIDSSPNAMAIEPEGFNTTHELISAMTYSKAPEFTKMVEKLIGVKAFHKALYYYYSKFKHGNATNQDWLDAMVHVSGDTGLYDMAKQWLRRNGHPTLYYSGEYLPDTKQYKLSLRQTGFEHHNSSGSDDSYEVSGPWRFPVDIALYNANGDDLLASIYNSNLACSPNQPKEDDCYTYDFKLAEDVIIFDNIDAKPSCVSVGRSWSFFGRIVNESADKDEQSLAQIQLDKDSVVKYFAYQTLTEPLRQQVITQFVNKDNGKQGPESSSPQPFTVQVDPKFVDLHAAILFNKDLDYGTRAMLIDEREMTSNHTLKHEYWAIADTTTALLQSIWYKYSEQIAQLYTEVNTTSSRQFPIIGGFSNRPLKFHLIKIIRDAYLKHCVVDGISQDEWSQLQQTTREKFPSIAIPVIVEDLLGSELMSDKSFGVSLAYQIITSFYSLDLDASMKQNTFVLSASPLIAPGHFEGTSCTTVSPHCQPIYTIDDATTLLSTIEQQFIKHADSLEQYILCVASADGANIQPFVEYLLTRDYFDYNLAGHARTFSRAWSMRRKRSLLTQTGLDYTVQQCYKIGVNNQALAYAFLQAFNDINAFTGDRKTMLVNALKSLHKSFDPIQQQSLYNNITRILDTLQQE